MKDVLDGLTILCPYYDNPSYQIGAEQDIIYVYPTNRPLTNEDVGKMIEFGWQQEDYADTFKLTDYNPEEGWVYYV